MPKHISPVSKKRRSLKERESDRIEDSLRRRGVSRFLASRTAVKATKHLPEEN
jgi:hypothetical protein